MGVCVYDIQHAQYRSESEITDMAIPAHVFIAQLYEQFNIKRIIYSLAIGILLLVVKVLLYFLLN